MRSPQSGSRAQVSASGCTQATVTVRAVVSASVYVTFRVIGTPAPSRSMT